MIGVMFREGIDRGIIGIHPIDRLVSTVSWEDAAKRAVETAAKSLRDLRMDLKVEDGKVLAYRTKLLLSFKYEE
jgi:hypothetical protein